MPPPSPLPPPAPDTSLPEPSVPAASDRGGSRRTFGYVNWFLILGSVLVAALSDLGADQERLMPLFISLQSAFSPDYLIEVRHGEVWRLFTPAFLHFSVAHIGFNLLGLKNVGDPMEIVHGWRFYLLLTSVLAVCTNLGQYFFYGSPYFGGMSGVLYGLFGYLWTRGMFDPVYPLRMPRQTIVIALVWFVACFTGVLGPIANGAHTVGLVLGAVWGLLASYRARTRMAARISDPRTGF